MFLFVFFFKYTAATEIYTYLHTLSHHDALPIFFHTTSYNHRYPVGSGYSPHGDSTRTGPRLPHPAGQGSCAVFCRRGHGCSNPCLIAVSGRRRSEEHTSELQSLMRISYAVFCLKKKKKQHKQNDTKVANL